MLDDIDIRIYQGTLDISRIPKKQLLARYKNLITQGMVLSNSNTRICMFLQEHHAEVWEELINHTFTTPENAEPETDAISHNENEARMLDETHSDIRDNIGDEEA